MWVMAISSLVCFAISTVLFTPNFRDFCLYQPLAFYFIFKGFWYVISFIVTTLWPYSNFMLLVEYIGTIILGIYILSRAYKHTKNKDLLS